jgi:hypothetical protein
VTAHGRDLSAVAQPRFEEKLPLAPSVAYVVDPQQQFIVMVTPSAFAALGLIVKKNRVSGSIGKSPGLSS